MSLQEVNPSSYPAGSAVPASSREATEAANRWLRRFHSLLQDTEMSAELCRERLRSVPALRSEGAAVLAALDRAGVPEDQEALLALRDAVAEMDARELELRHRLALLSPGDAEAGVDLVALRDQLPGTGQPSILDYPSILELTISPPNWTGAAILGALGAVWLIFTTVQALFLLNEWLHRIGFAALIFLALYAVIFAVGAAMLTGAARAAIREELFISGREMVIRRKVGAYENRKSYTVSPDSRAYVKETTGRRSGAAGAAQAAVTDADGREVLLGCGRPLPELELLVERLNAYLSVLR